MKWLALKYLTSVFQKNGVDVEMAKVMYEKYWGMNIFNFVRTPLINNGVF